jgi:hypothetical protein
LAGRHELLSSATEKKGALTPASAPYLANITGLAISHPESGSAGFLKRPLSRRPPYDKEIKPFIASAQQPVELTVTVPAFAV